MTLPGCGLTSAVTRTVVGVGCVALLLATVPAVAAAAAGWRTLAYGGERFEVPASWPVDDLGTEPSTCVRFDRHAVYEGRGGPAPSCPPQLAGVSEAIQVQPLDALGRSDAGPDLRSTTIGGQPALVNTNQAITQRLVAAFPAAGVLVTISFGAGRATAEQILASFAPLRAGASAPAATTTGSTTAGSAAASSATAAAAAAAAGSVATTGAATAGSATTTTGYATTGSDAAGPATVGPATAAGAAPGPSLYTGKGFDACAAPSEGSMAAWKRYSPFSSTGVYIGGVNRACGNGWLSASWVDAEVAAGWSLIPLYVGPQASCAFQGGLAPISSGTAATTQGIEAAEDAVEQASYFGMGAGSPIYYDMEAWNTANSSCSAAVVTFVEAWSEQLEREGYDPGIYGSAGAGIATDIAPLYGHTGGPRLVDVADWDGQANTDIPYLPNNVWTAGQRIKQYQGNVDETYDGVTIPVDEDYSDSVLVGDSQPTVTAVSPNAASVGTTVTVEGVGYVPGETTVSFGGVPAAAVSVSSAGELTARSPARAIGTVDVTVSTPGGSSVPGPADRFVYVPVVAAASEPSSAGYVVAAALGRVFNFHTLSYGSAAGTALSAPVVGMAHDEATGGYWLVTAAGTVYGYNAPVLGSVAGLISSPVVGIAADDATGGYWLVSAKGNVYPFRAPFYGSPFKRVLPAAIVGIVDDPITGGYRVVSAKGNVYPFHAGWYGSTAQLSLPSPIVGMADDATTGGYWLTTSTGAVYTFNAPEYGSLAGHVLAAPVVAVTATATGYLLTTAAGNVVNFNTPWYGSPAASG